MAALLEIAPAAHRVDATTDRSYKAFKTDDTSTWPEYKKALGRYADAATTVEARIAAITPPKNLAKAHALLQKSWRMNYEWATFMYEQLRLKEPYSSWRRGWASRYSAQLKVSHQWKVAIRAAALRLHTPLPKKLMQFK